eukprot:58568-Chlamydomonas_euryale.AAC.4
MTSRTVKRDSAVCLCCRLANPEEHHELAFDPRRNASVAATRPHACAAHGVRAWACKSRDAALMPGATCPQ